MARLRKPVDSVATLDKEIYRLRLHAKKQEKQFDANASFLKENFGNMVYNSIFRRHYESGAAMFKSKLAEGIWNNEKLQQSVGQLIEHLLNKMADGIERISGKSKEKSEPE